MNSDEPVKFSNYNEWESACVLRQYEGPYRIAGQPHMVQYVREGEGTRAIWNDDHSIGYVFGVPKDPQA